jgi:ligand-binding SRPBCC domain-containing protein
MNFRHRFEVQASIEEVERFHGDAQALKWLTPPPIFVRFEKLEPLGEGSIADFTMWLGFLPIRWVAVHRHVSRQGFTDEQVRGPFNRWVHRHRFKAISGRRTSVEDEIDFSLRRHALWGPVGLAMGINLPLLFLYRAWKTKRILER